VIEVHYKWQPKTNDPNEIDGVFLNQEHVPSIGDKVSVNCKCEGENVSHYGKVFNVLWQVAEDKTTVVVNLS